MQVKVKKIKENAKLPTQGSSKAAAYDLYACTPNGKRLVIWPNETILIGTGLVMMPEEGFYGAIYARSGLASKHGLRPANCVGIIDEDYRGEVMVALHNDSAQRYYMEDGERIAQIMFHRYYPTEFEEVDELPETDRGEGGFGSTGI